MGVMVSAVANGPKTVALYSEKTAEIKTLKIGPWIKDRILLVYCFLQKSNVFKSWRVRGIFSLKD